MSPAFQVAPLCETCEKDCKKEVMRSLYESMKKKESVLHCKNYKKQKTEKKG